MMSITLLYYNSTDALSAPRPVALGNCSLASADGPHPDPPRSPEIQWLDYLSPRPSCVVQ